MITAKVIADSITKDGERITTFELEYPRFIHGELMTHRLFSRNAASSRAIPINKMMDQVLTAPAMPVEWGLNKSGMQAEEKHKSTSTCEWAWKQAAERAVVSARELQGLGLHKQIVNRVLEPFQLMKTIVTATEYDNFFWLRRDPDAQPEIHTLADKMYGAYTQNEPNLLKPGEWHLPYVSVEWCPAGSGITYGREGLESLTLEEAKMVSASCCAQVSYRLLDDSLEKAVKIYDMLVTMTPVHASPFEHIATPMEVPENLESWEWAWEDVSGITHVDKVGNYWSGNLKGWIQYRHLLDNNACWDYNPET
jgi:thymidylate synthase ThyX